jgi:curved DNA-binding protein CbpA
MSKNYYEILELNRGSSCEEIANSYSRLALKFHPKNSSESERAVYNYEFHQIAEAYEVLSDRKLLLNRKQIKEEFTIFTDTTV